MSTIDKSSLFEPKMDGLVAEARFKFVNPEAPNSRSVRTNVYNQTKLTQITDCVKANQEGKNRYQSASTAKKIIAVALIVVGVALILTGLGAGAGIGCATMGVKFATGALVGAKIITLIGSAKLAIAAAVLTVLAGVAGIIAGAKLLKVTPAHPAQANAWTGKAQDNKDEPLATKAMDDLDLSRLSSQGKKKLLSDAEVGIHGKKVPTLRTPKKPVRTMDDLALVRMSQIEQRDLRNRTLRPLPIAQDPAEEGAFMQSTFDPNSHVVPKPNEATAAAAIAGAATSAGSAGATQAKPAATAAAPKKADKKADDKKAAAAAPKSPAPAKADDKKGTPKAKPAAKPAAAASAGPTVPVTELTQQPAATAPKK
jgi:hypothetical protein